MHQTYKPPILNTLSWLAILTNDNANKIFDAFSNSYLG